jgi:homoserine acetyltransferase
LTGNSQVIGESGWWNDIVGVDKTIDTRKYTIVSFDVPGNGFNSATIENYRDFIARDIARIFIEGLRVLKLILYLLL